MFLQNAIVGRVTHQVVPFVRISPHVIEFFRVIGIVDVAPVLGADSVIVVIVRSNSGSYSRGEGVLQLRRQAETLESLLPGQAAELNQCGVYVKQFRGPAA